MRSNFLNATSALAIGLTGLMASAPAYAQNEEGGSSRFQQADEIIVTAQRREQSVLEVPIAISAITAEEIEKRGADRLSDIQTSIPGFWAVELYPGSERVQIRGISQQIGLPTVATYIDELVVTPPSVQGGQDIRVIDVERVEVLRGPQPTLYGEGSMGGTIRYITRKPNLQDMEIRLEGSAGTIAGGSETYRTEGAVGVPIVKDKLGLRVSAAYDNSGGWVDTPRGENANETTSLTVRGNVLAQPTDRLSLTGTLLYQETEQDDANFANSSLDVFTPIAQRGDAEYILGNGVIEYDFDGFSFLSSTGYYESDTLFDLAFQFAVPTPFGLFPVDSLSRNVGDFERFTQEFRVTSDLDGPIQYILGATYTDDETVNGGFILGGPAPIALPDTINSSEAYAVYGELSYEAGPWSLLGGLRYFEDKRTTSVVPGVSQTFDSLNPRVNISYALSNGIIYANASKGFRSGGFNTPGLFAPGEETFDPEELWSYEIGTKQQFADNRLTVEAAVYYSDYKDIQAIEIPIDNSPRQGRTLNRGAASGFGADFSLSLQASEFATLGATLGLNDLKYDSNNAAVIEGDALDLTPSLTASWYVDLDKPISDDMSLIGRLDFGYSSELTSTGRNIPSIPIRQLNGDPFPAVVTIDARTVINANLGIARDAYSVKMFVRNLTNNTDAVYGGGVIVAEEGVRPRPRTIGVEFAADF